MVYKTLHRKVKIKQQEPHSKYDLLNRVGNRKDEKNQALQGNL
jgi:hypothetical protein